MNTSLDYYFLLGVERGATADEIKRAYRKAVFRYHPDRNPGDSEAAEKFKHVLDGYEILSDKKKRSVYDEVTRPAENEQTVEEENGQAESDKFDEISVNTFNSISATSKRSNRSQNARLAR